MASIIKVRFLENRAFRHAPDRMITRGNENRRKSANWHGGCFYRVHMLERMKKEIKENHHSAAPVHERAGAAEKNIFFFVIFGLTFPFGFVIMFCS
jgi:hypothetical protein